MVAGPGSKEYGALTVMINFYGTTELVCTVPKNVFYPAPKVDSAVLKITPHPSGIDWELYPFLHRVVQAAFGQRRKTLLNALGILEPEFGGKERLREFLSETGINPGQRGETIDVHQFTVIARELQKQTLEGV